MVDVQNIVRTLLIAPFPHRTFLGTESGKPIDSNPDFSEFGFVIRMKASFLKACKFLDIYLLHTCILFYTRIYSSAIALTRSK